MISTISIQHVSKSFNNRVILNDVSLSFSNTEIVALLGPNGSGKTTLFYITAGLTSANNGTVYFNDSDITKLPMYLRARMGLGYLPQDVSIFRRMNVEDNIDAILEIHYPNKVERKKILDELIEDFSISHLRKAPALSLSGGERRRIEIARTIAAKPKFILLDEPFAGVDPIAIADLRSLILSLKKKGIGILITDHNAKETLSIIDRGYILYEGKIMFQGTTQEIMDSPAVRDVYLGNQYNN